MNRREFFKKAAMIAAGAVAADQLELLERLGHSKIWSGADFTKPYLFKEYKLGFLVTQEMIDDDHSMYGHRLVLPRTHLKSTMLYASS